MFTTLAGLEGAGWSQLTNTTCGFVDLHFSIKPSSDIKQTIHLLTLQLSPPLIQPLTGQNEDTGVLWVPVASGQARSYNYNGIVQVLLQLKHFHKEGF